MQGGGTGHPKKGVVLLAETDALALEFGGEERMTVDPVARWEGEKRTHAHDDGAEHFIANVEVIVSIGGPLPSGDAVMGVVGLRQDKASCCDRREGA